MILSRD